MDQDDTVVIQSSADRSIRLKDDGTVQLVWDGLSVLLRLAEFMQLEWLLEVGVVELELTKVSDGSFYLEQVQPGKYRLGLGQLELDLQLIDFLDLVKLAYTAARKLSRYVDQPLPRKEEMSAVWTAFQQHAAEGLPSIEPGTPLMVVLALIADYLRDNGIVRSLSYSQNERSIACQFKTCPWADCCPAAHHQSLTCHLLRQLVQTTLDRAGYQVETVLAGDPKAMKVTFDLHLLKSDN